MMDEPQMPEDELMSLEGINSIEARFDLNAPIAIMQMNELIKTARAAHVLEQKLIDVLDSNKNLDHSNKMLREEIGGINERYGAMVRQYDDAVAAWMNKWGQEREENEKLRDAVTFIRVLGEEMVICGYDGLGREQILKSMRDMRAQNEVLKNELKQEQAKRHDWAKLKEEVRIAIEAFTDPEGNMPADTGEFRDLKRVLGKL